MIPNDKTVYQLWKKYDLPPNKQVHCKAVAKVAMEIAKKYILHAMPAGKSGTQYIIDTKLLRASALLHDIDKNIKNLPGERHPDAGVRILVTEGLEEVAEVIRTHPLHMILDDVHGPKTIEQQLLFLADKLTKNECIGLEKRYEAWKKEDYDEQSQRVLTATYPKVIALRDTILGNAGITEDELVNLVR